MTIYPCPKPPKKKKKKVWYDFNKVEKTMHENDIYCCEVQFDTDKEEDEGCMGSEGRTYAHRHKRRWYLNKGDLINDFDQIIHACAYCHEIIEKNPKLTIETFKRLRG